MQKALRTLVTRCACTASVGTSATGHTAAVSVHGVRTAWKTLVRDPTPLDALEGPYSSAGPTNNPHSSHELDASGSCTPSSLHATTASAVLAASPLIPSLSQPSSPLASPFSPAPWWQRPALRHSPHSPAAAPAGARHYAKAAAKGAAAPAVAVPGPKRYRTSWTKLYSCRNDRLRHTHEQIWPTMQLTEAEAAMFRRNSRLFVVDMGKTLTLGSKFRMGAMADARAGGGQPGGGGGGGRVPYQDARALLQEPQPHLDAIGENPRYLRLRRLSSAYATKLQNVRKLRLLLGFQRRRFLQRMYETSLLAKGGHRMWKLVCAMEAHLPMFATRMGLAEDVTGAAAAVRHGKLAVNGVRPGMPYKAYLAPGDVVSPAAGAASTFRRRIERGMGPLMEDVARSFMQGEERRAAGPALGGGGMGGGTGR